MRRRDFLVVVYANGMYRRVRKGTGIPTPAQAHLYYRMNQHGHLNLEVAS